jgi:hypothetical protein
MDLRSVALVPPGASPTWPTAIPPLATAHATAGDEVARNPASVAKVILDASLSQQAREAAVTSNPQFASELIAEMTRDLVPGTPAESERIPWIWRVASACGRRGDTGQLKKLLAVAVPHDGQPLLDWQAVTIGGGVIAGTSDRGQWPATRVAEIVKDDPDPDLRQRFPRAVELASTKADDEKVPVPTRYDALRMLAAEPWDKVGPRLTRYLASETNEELQSGAVAAVGDIDAPGATAALIEAVPHLTGNNRTAALTALLRTDQRVAALVDAIEAGKIDRSALDTSFSEKLLNHTSGRLKGRAAAILKR